ADRNLTLPGRVSRQGQVRQIGATDQQNHTDGGEQNVKRLAQLRAYHRVRKEVDANALSLVGIRIILRDPRIDRVHLRSSLLERDASLQFGKRAEPVEITRHVRGLKRQRPPDLREGPIERAPRGQYSDHGVGDSVEANGFTDYGGVGA